MSTAMQCSYAPDDSKYCVNIICTCVYVHIQCRYTYYTELPEDFYPEEIRTLRQKASSGISQVETHKKRLSIDKDGTNSPLDDSPKTNHNRLHNQQKQPKLQIEGNNSQTPVIMMTLECGWNKTKSSTKDPKSEVTLSTVGFEEGVTSCRLPTRFENSHQQLCLERQSSRSFFHLKRSSSRLMSMRRPTLRRKMTEIKYVPHTTINMRLSDGPTDSIKLCDGGPSLELSSHLSIVNVSTSY